MDVLLPFRLPFIGLKEGKHQFQYQLDKFFFEAFEDSLLHECSIAVSAELEKGETHTHLSIRFTGTFASECDRCLTQIDIPISGMGELLFKYADENREGGPDLEFIRRDLAELDISTYVYEYITLAVPMIRTYDCEDQANPPCDRTMLDQLSSHQQSKLDNPFEEQLKGIKFE